MSSLMPETGALIDPEAGLNGAGRQHATQQPSGVSTLAEDGRPAGARGVSFSEKNGDMKQRGPSRNNMFARMRHELSHESIDEKELSQQEYRPVPHHYFLQRPRALQYTYRGERIGYGEDAAPIMHTVSGASDVRYTAEGVAKARERIDLFIDLVWVGIIANLSEVFSEIFFEAEAQSGKAFIMFLIVFLPAWRIWNFLREFLNSFYMDDSLQRVFIFWILTLSVFFGNEIAYFAEDYETVKTRLIVTYIVIRGSFVAIELVYSYWIPWIRKLIFVGFVIMIPASAMWVGAIFTDGARALGPALGAIIWEYFVPLILDTPIGEKLLPSEYRKEVDPIHVRGRMGNFLIITIGEGVLMLIRGGPIGFGIQEGTPLAVWSLLIYFLLAYMYFARDGSVRYIPAVRHKGFRLMFWLSSHIPIFASFITLSAGILWTITHNATAPVEGDENPELSEEEIAHLTARAIWDIALSISIIVLSYLWIALLDKPLDPPKTTLVNNRYIRMLGRPVYIAVILGTASIDNIDVILYLGICGLGMSLLTLYEMILSLERPARLFEPKGLTVLMKKEYRQELPSEDHGPENIRIPI